MEEGWERVLEETRVPVTLAPFVRILGGRVALLERDSGVGEGLVLGALAFMVVLGPIGAVLSEWWGPWVQIALALLVVAGFALIVGLTLRLSRRARRRCFELGWERLELLGDEGVWSVERAEVARVLACETVSGWSVELWLRGGRVEVWGAQGWLEDEVRWIVRLWEAWRRGGERDEGRAA